MGLGQVLFDTESHFHLNETAVAINGGGLSRWTRCPFQVEIDSFRHK